MSTRHDDFYNSVAENGFLFTDAWVAQGGECVYLEWSSDNVLTSDFVWSENFSQIQFNSTSTDFIGTVVHISHENDRNGSAVVIIKIQLPRIVAQTETITIPILGNRVIAQASGTEKVSVPNEIITVRNYSNVNTSGALTIAARSGSSPYLVQTDPLLDTNLDFNLSTGNNISFETKQGGFTLNSADSDFNGEDSYSASDQWIGKMTGFAGFGTSFTLFMCVKIPVDASIFYSTVIQTGGGGGGFTDVGEPDDAPQFIAVLDGSNNSSDPLVFNITDYWTVQENSGIGIQRLYGDWLTGGSNVGKKVGKVEDRVMVFAIRSDGTIFGSAGKKTVISSDILDVIITETTEQYHAFRTSGAGTCKIAEILNIDSELTDIQVQEYLSFMDEKYATSSQSFNVDLTSGNDTTGDGTSGTPYKTINKAITDCMVGSGDSVLVNNGSTDSFTEEIVLSIDSADSDHTIALGYSPDYPFILSTYGARSGGRPVLDFASDVPQFLLSALQNENIVIAGLHLKSTERDILDGSFVGQGTLQGESDGFGIYFDPTGTNVTAASSISLCVFDCEIQNTLRHGITLTKGTSGTHNAYKYSSVVQTSLHDMYNMNYASQNQNSGLLSSNYGIAGIFNEKTTGLHIQDCLFYRVGWSPNLELDSGISVGSVKYQSAESGFFSAAAGSLLPYFTLYDEWAGSSTALHNNQRVKIIQVNGSPVDETLHISSGINVVGSSLGIQLKDVPTTAVNGDTCNIQVLDPLPRCSGNADIIVGQESYGPLTVSNCIFVESSGFNLISTNSYFSDSNVSGNNQFGMLVSPQYSKVSNSFYGVSAGTAIIRKAPNDASNAALFVDGLTVGDPAYNHGWFVKTVENSKITNLDIRGNIFAGGNTVGFGELVDGIPTSAALYFDRNVSGDIKCFIEKNTFYSIPGTAIAFHTEEASSTQADFTFVKNLVDQNDNFSPETNYVYSFKDPHTLIGSVVWSGIKFGGESNKGVYNVNSEATAPSTGFAYNVIPVPANMGYPQWSSIIFNSGNNPSPDNSTWTDVTFATVGRSLATYSRDILSGTTSAVDFASIALSEHNLGWSTGVNAETVLTYIREGWTPTSLDQVNFNNDFVGAVAFDFTAPAGTFKPYFGAGTDNFGYGKGE